MRSHRLNTGSREEAAYNRVSRIIHQVQEVRIRSERSAHDHEAIGPDCAQPVKRRTNWHPRCPEYAIAVSRQRGQSSLELKDRDPTIPATDSSHGVQIFPGPLPRTAKPCHEITASVVDPSLSLAHVYDEKAAWIDTDYRGDVYHPRRLLQPERIEELDECRHARRG